LHPSSIEEVMPWKRSIAMKAYTFDDIGHRILYQIPMSVLLRLWDIKAVDKLKFASKY
jgi:hypothetical protein